MKIKLHHLNDLLFVVLTAILRKVEDWRIWSSLPAKKKPGCGSPSRLQTAAFPRTKRSVTFFTRRDNVQFSLMFNDWRVESELFAHVVSRDTALCGKNLIVMFAIPETLRHKNGHGDDDREEHSARCGRAEPKTAVGNWL